MAESKTSWPAPSWVPSGWEAVPREQVPDAGLGPQPSPLPSYAAPAPDYEAPGVYQPGEFTRQMGVGGSQLISDLARWTRVGAIGALQGATLGGADEAVGFLVGIFPGGDTVAEAIARQQEIVANAQQDDPGLFAIANLAGAGASGYGLARSVANAPAAITNVVSPLARAKPTFSSIAPRALAEGVGYGAVGGALTGTTGQERRQGALTGAFYGVPLSALGGALSHAASKFSRSTNPVRSAPTVDQLNNQYRALRSTAEQVGLRFETTQFDRWAGNTYKRIANEFSQATRVNAILDELTRLPPGPTLSDLEARRRQLSILIREAGDSASDQIERVAAIQARQAIDNWIAGLDESRVMIGNNLAVPNLNVRDLLAQSRNVYQRLSTSELIEEALSDVLSRGMAAGKTRGDMATDIRVAFNRLLKDEGDRFTGAQRQLMQDVVGRNPVEGLLQILSNFSISDVFSDPLRAFISLGAAGGAGYALGQAAGLGPSGYFALPVIAEGASRGTLGMVKEEARLAAAAARAGLPYVPRTPATTAAMGRAATFVPPSLAPNLLTDIFEPDKRDPSLDQWRAVPPDQVPYVPPR